MKVFTNWFSGTPFERLGETLVSSLQANCPSADVEVMVTPQPPAVPGLSAHYTDNAGKLHAWFDAVKANRGNRLVLLDADTVVLRDLAPVWDIDGGAWDIAWTHRPGRLPMNGGVLFLNVTDDAIAFFAEWVRRDDALIRRRWRDCDGDRKYGGVNQASFVDLACDNRGLGIAKLKGIPCRTWNSVDETWDTFSDQTRVLHIKGDLRRMVFGEPLADERQRAMLRPLCDAWRRHDAVAAGRVAA